jgi:Cu-processing system permease protein
VRALAVARDLLREARARRWVLAALLGVTGLLLLLAFGLELEVVDGALAMSRFFQLGPKHAYQIRAVDVALRPLFEAVSYLVFYGGSLFGVVACADFAPALLAPGRIEHLLALPVRRLDLALGTFLGVLALVLLLALYGAVGFTLVLWWKSGFLDLAPVAAATFAAVGFTAIYAVMLLAAMVARSAALSAGAGVLVLVLGIVAGERASLAPLFSPGLSRGLFLAVTAPLPRISELARHGARFAYAQPLDPAQVAVQVAGTLLFAAAALALASALFERKDF